MGCFLQEILKHGSRFLPKKSINMGQLFWLSPKLRDFQGFRHAKNPKIAEFWKNRPIFEGKSLKNGYPFWPKSPLKMGMGFEARAAHPCPTQIWVPPRALSWQLLGVFRFFSTIKITLISQMHMYCDLSMKTNVWNTARRAKIVDALCLRLFLCV